MEVPLSDDESDEGHYEQDVRFHEQALNPELTLEATLRYDDMKLAVNANPVRSMQVNYAAEDMDDFFDNFSDDEKEEPPQHHIPAATGRLHDRIERLRQSCIDGLGEEVFWEAHAYLLQCEQDSLGFDGNGRNLNDDDFEANKIAGCRAILGQGKAQYINLIEQLIFMEESGR